MKLKNIAKASLALGILTTGMITTTAQPVKASTLEVRSQATQDLKDYYKGQSFDLKNIGGYKEGNKVTFIYHNQQIDVTITGNEKLEFNDDGEISNVDVFVVRENSDRSGITSSNGGITTSNKQDIIDNVKSVNMHITKKTDKNSETVTSSYYSIDKENISLKELDFKLRKHLIDNNGLYNTEPKDSKIKVTMQNGDFYTFELNKKLQTHRMGDVIDGRNIEKIEVNL
ncbi:TPA: superantigen-like protein SSL11 [Staphylococcus aureus]|uniref:superantigen-like protein SSL11 n=3 Tax=Staphylococcus aureus TaxID=1280 RepID=UPI0005C27499|nr:superantigen-like protein SSL11 [Staphylococcus aureus]HDH6407871.1 superantigen-like protein SSL11 [Staphylococcus aureus MRSA-Lux-40]AJP21653.1 superantigen-like protein [Staphylococcus aureus]ATZ15836.1 superantigen-like protein SSL11 [Staphylococcus aureus]EJX2103544.1 superantigen-like protein SSL11 [Staphylococcus aureus]EKF1404706.1 superantigen-like protein SSL11 [Staphylococcus aureus]